jgi:hypothetical protein
MNQAISHDSKYAYTFVETPKSLTTKTLALAYSCYEPQRSAGAAAI